MIIFSKKMKLEKNIKCLYMVKLGNSFTFNTPILEETLTILGEVDSWSRRRRASVTLSAPKKL